MGFDAHDSTLHVMTSNSGFAFLPYSGLSLLALAVLLVAAVVLRRQLPIFQRLGPDLAIISRPMGGLQEWREATRFGGLAVERGILAVALGSAMGVFCLNAAAWSMPTWVYVLTCMAAVALVGLTGFFAGQALHFGRRALASRQRFLGKRMVHDALNGLVAAKYIAVHDLSLDGLGLDHVVIGPSGVFLLETQTVMQHRSRFETGDSYQATYDGRSMVFRRRRLNGPLDAVRKKSIRLAEWLFDKVGEKIVVKPVLVVPGWRVERFGQGLVRVANQVELPEVLEAAADEELFRENLAVRIESGLKEIQVNLDQPDLEPELDEVAEDGEPARSKRWWSLRPRLKKRAKTKRLS